MTPPSHLHGGAELVPVQLHRLSEGRGHVQSLAARVEHRVVLGAKGQHLAAGAEAAKDAVVPRHAAPHQDPAECVLGLEDGDVELAVRHG
jgi:hypothetical protein